RWPCLEDQHWRILHEPCLMANKGEGCAKMATVQDDPGATFSGLPMALHGLGMRRGRGHAERSRRARLVRTRGAMCCTQMPTRPLRMAQDRRSPSDCGVG